MCVLVSLCAWCVRCVCVVVWLCVEFKRERERERERDGKERGAFI